jgi:hypothetical protein
MALDVFGCAMHNIRKPADVAFAVPVSHAIIFQYSKYSWFVQTS